MGRSWFPVVDTLLAAFARQESQTQQISQKIDNLAEQIAEIPIREFDQHMAAGRRHLQDLPPRWRTEQDRHELIHDARAEFVRASATAELMKDAQRWAVAEVAIAGCWLWVPSLHDVQNTVSRARRVLEQEMLFGASLPTGAYSDVLALCRSYGERPAKSATPIAPDGPWAPTPGARLAVQGIPGEWVECAGVEVNLGSDATAAETTVTSAPIGLAAGPWLTVITRTAARDSLTVTVRNARRERIAVSLTPDAVVVQLAAGTLPAVTEVEPGTESTLTLTRPTLVTVEKIAAAPHPTGLWDRFPEWAVPHDPTVGFMLAPGPT